MRTKYIGYVAAALTLVVAIWVAMSLDPGAISTPALQTSVLLLRVFLVRDPLLIAWLAFTTRECGVHPSRCPARSHDHAAGTTRAGSFPPGKPAVPIIPVPYPSSTMARPIESSSKRRHRRQLWPHHPSVVSKSNGGSSRAGLGLRYEHTVRPLQMAIRGPPTSCVTPCRTL